MKYWTCSLFRRHNSSGALAGRKSSGLPSPIRDVGPRMKGEYDIMYATRKDNDTLRLDLLEHIVRCPLFRSKGQVIQ